MLRRAARRVADLIVLLLVMEVSVGFVDPTHPIVAILIAWASTCGALRQMTAWRAGQPLPSVAPSFKHGWVFVGVVWWFAGTCAGAHQLFQWQVPQMPFAVQTVGLNVAALAR
jgi:hypothetical protein